MGIFDTLNAKITKWYSMGLMMFAPWETLAVMRNLFCPWEREKARGASAAKISLLGRISVRRGFVFASSVTASLKRHFAAVRSFATATSHFGQFFIIRDQRSGAHGVGGIYVVKMDMVWRKWAYILDIEWSRVLEEMGK